MFAFLGRVRLSVLYDNDRCPVTRILPNGTRKRATLFSGMLSHYVIEDRYNRPGKGNDKGAVEGTVGWSRRNFMVATAVCDLRRVRRLAGGAMPQAAAGDPAGAPGDEAMMPLPAAAFKVCDQSPGRVSSQALVRYRSSSVKEFDPVDRF